MFFRQTIIGMLMLGPVVLPTAAQELTFSGDWTVFVTSRDGSKYQAILVIEGEGGTWKSLLRDHNNPCVGRKSAVSITSATSDELTFRIKFSQALLGCQDDQVTLKRIDETTLKGHRGTDEVLARRP